MKKIYKVTRDFQGYVRGWEVKHVLAESEEEAMKIFYSEGDHVDSQIVRDDCETTDIQAEEICQ